MSIRVVLVDDTQMFRDGLQAFLELEPDLQVVGVAGNGEAGVAITLQERPDVVLLDIRMPVMDGVTAAKQIKQALPEIAIVMLTTYNDDAYLFEAIRAGAVGYLLKDMPATKLVEAIRTVVQGGALISPESALKLIQAFNQLAPGSVAAPRVEVADLSEREREILRLLADGLSNKEIAGQLFLSEGTVKNYVSSIFAKLHARHRAQAISMAIRQGLLE